MLRLWDRLESWGTEEKSRPYFRKRLVLFKPDGSGSLTSLQALGLVVHVASNDHRFVSIERGVFGVEVLIWPRPHELEG